MYLQDFVLVDASFDDVAEFVADLDSGFEHWLDAALRENGELALGPRWKWPSVAVDLEVDPPLIGVESVLLSFTWRATAVTALVPEMRAEIALHAFGTGQTHAQFRGRYTPPLAAAGRLLDNAGLHRVAEMTVRLVLERFDRALTRSLNRTSLEP